MAKQHLLSWRAMLRLLYVGPVVILLLLALKKVQGSRESTLYGNKRSNVSVKEIFFGTTYESKNVSRIGFVCFEDVPSPNLEKFVDPLPRLPHVDVSDRQQHVLKAYKKTQVFHRDLPPTTVYAFGTSKSKAHVPGPALIAKRNVPTYIRWENHIDDEDHLLPVDGTLTRAVPAKGGVPIVAHLHGMESESRYDGHPEAWFTKLGDTGSAYVTQDYIYPNTVLPAMIWYHDHTVGITRLNVAAGLAGPYIIRGDASEEPVGLPHGAREIILCLQDKTFLNDGSINYPTVGDDTMVHPSWCPAYFGDTIIVNGKIWPYLHVLPLKYRLRILNAASDRYFQLSLDKSNMPFIKIGSDGGYLDAPVTLDVIILAPGERVDCIVDFGGLSNGTKILLKNSAAAPYPGPPGYPPLSSESGASSVLQFRVGSSSLTDWSLVPTALADSIGINHTVLTQPNEIRVRRFALTEQINNVGRGTALLLANRTWEDPATELVPLTSVEIWEFISLTPGIDHPIHIHLVKFQLLSVQPLNVTRLYVDKTCDIRESYGRPDSCFLDISRGPNPQEIGWKDTISAATGSVTRILLRFTSQDGQSFPFDPTAEPGYLWHCHLLSHEDNAMMRPLIVKSSIYQPDPDLFNYTTGFRR